MAVEILYTEGNIIGLQRELCIIIYMFLILCTLPDMHCYCSSLCHVQQLMTCHCGINGEKKKNSHMSIFISLYNGIIKKHKSIKGRENGTKKEKKKFLKCH